jgi:hypothetical protein
MRPPINRSVGFYFVLALVCIGGILFFEIVGGIDLLIFWGPFAALLITGLIVYNAQGKSNGRSTVASKLVIVGLLALFALLYVYFNYFYQRV